MNNYLIKFNSFLRTVATTLILLLASTTLADADLKRVFEERLYHATINLEKCIDRYNTILEVMDADKNFEVTAFVEIYEGSLEIIEEAAELVDDATSGAVYTARATLRDLVIANERLVEVCLSPFESWDRIRSILLTPPESQSQRVQMRQIRGFIDDQNERLAYLRRHL